MTCEIFYNSVPCGRLNVSEEGLYTVFGAECEYIRGVLRLWLGSFSLGVMQPEGNKLVLRRKLSRAETAKLPKFDRAVLSAAPPEITAPDMPAPPSESGKWTLQPDGTLRSDSYIAIPSALRRRVSGVRVEYIDGREYLLFRY